jgi:hypothetical protein
VSSYLTVSPLPLETKGGLFSVALSVEENFAWPLASTLLYKVRTFLTLFERAL